MTRTHPRITFAVLALALLSAAACVGFNNPEGWAGPAETEGLLIASTDRGELSALSMDDFSPVWTFPTGQEDPEIDLEAIYTTPPVINGTVYLASYSEEVYALSVETGEPVWGPIVVDGPVIAGLAASESTVYAATDAGTLYALNAEDGARVDTFDAGDSIWGAPLLDEGVIYVASVNGKLYALDAQTLSPAWDDPFETENGLISDLVLADGMVLVGGIGRTLHAVAADSGEERWSFEADNWFWGRPLVANGTVYAPNLDGRLFALSLETGAELWSFEAEDPDPLRSTPVLAGGLLVIIDRGGNVYGIEPANGSLVWSKALEATVLSDPLVLTLEAGAAEEVFISAQGGDLFRVEDTTTGKVTRLDPASGTFIEVVTR